MNKYALVGLGMLAGFGVALGVLPAATGPKGWLGAGFVMASSAGSVPTSAAAVPATKSSTKPALKGKLPPKNKSRLPRREKKAQRKRAGLL